MDLEDFIVSNNLLPLGSLGYLLFCTRKNGWGWDNFIAEVNAGTGMKFPKCLKNYVAYGIPAIIIVIYLKGYYDKFAGSGNSSTGRMDDRGTGTAGIRILLCNSEEESETVSGARISARPENNKRCNHV